MGIASAVYGILLFLTLVAFSVPWARIGEEIYTGWNFMIPFSITYPIGLVLGLVVLITRRYPVVMTIVAGVLMLVGVAMAYTAIGFAKILETFLEEEVCVEAGLGLAILAPVIYMVLGAIVGKKMQIWVE